MNDDDLHGPRLSPPPSTAPIVRGAAIALVTVALVVPGCGTQNPGAPPWDSGPRVVDAGISIGDSGNPGRPANDAGNPGANPGTAPLDGGSGP